MAFNRTTFIGDKMKHYNNFYDYVEVMQEPSHKEVFINDQSRIYLVDIPPGEKTLFHRHSVDTVYIVLSEGWIKLRMLIRAINIQSYFQVMLLLLTNVKWHGTS